MNISSLGDPVRNFAHLLNGRGTVVAAKGKKAKAEDEDEKEDEKEEKKKAEEPPKDDKEDGKKDAKKSDDEKDDEPCMSEGEEDEEEEDEEEEDEGEKKKKKSKKAKAAAGFDKATLSRCESIFLSEHAAGRPDVACSLAFKSKLSTDEAINVMASLGPVASVKPNSLANRMSKVINPNVGVDAPSGSSQGEAATLAAKIVAAAERGAGK